MDYLALLRDREINTPRSGTAKTAKSPADDFTQFLQSASGANKNSHPELGEHRRWRVALAGRLPFLVTCCPAPDRAWLERMYPGGELHPLLDHTTDRTATQAERAELEALIRHVLREEPGEVDQALATALTDVDAALECYRHLAEEL